LSVVVLLSSEDVNPVENGFGPMKAGRVTSREIH
jgi:hypothetical protein